VGLELVQHQPPEAAALHRVGDGERDVGDRRAVALAQVPRRPDDVVVDEGEQADVAVAVDVGQRVEHLRR